MNELKAVWQLGFVGGLVIAAELLSYGMLIGISLCLVAELFGRETTAWLRLVLYSAPLWAPLAIGDALRRQRDWGD